MNVRLATEADLPAIVAIYNESIPARRATADVEPQSVEARMGWFHNRDWSRRPIWVCCDEADGPVIAWVSLNSCFKNLPAFAATAESSLYITTSRQAHGLGPRLLEFALAQCPALGIRHVLGFIFAHNIPSRRMAERAGFQLRADLPAIARVEGNERGLVVYQYDVPANG